jgi:hypothetical protein
LTPFARAVAAELLAAGLFATAYATAARLLPWASTLLHWVGVVVAAAWTASAIFHLLSIFGAFRLPVVLASILLAAGLATWIGGRQSIRSRMKRDLRWHQWLRRRVARSAHRAVILCIALLAAVVILHSLLLPPLGWDSLTYHAVKAGTWVQRGGIADLVAPGTWALYQNLWGGAEVLTAWSMLPFHGDTLAMATQGACWLALGLALVTLVRELGAREPFASSVAALALATPTVRMQVGTGYVEVVELALLVSGMALAVTFLRRPRGGHLMLAAAALGLAGGVKFTCAPTSSLILVVVSLYALAKGAPPRYVAAAFAIFAISIAPWLWSAYQTTGAPLSPVPVSIFGLSLGRANPEIEAYLARPIPASNAAAEVDRLISALWSGYENPGAVTVVAMVLGIATCPRLLWRRPLPALVVLLAIAAGWLQYYSPGLSVVRHYWPASSVRFLMVPLVLGAALSATPFRPCDRRGRYYLWLLWIGTLFDLGLYLARDVSGPCAVGIAGLLAALALLSAALFALFRCSRSKAVRIVAWVAAASLFLAVVDGAHDRLRGELARMGFVRGPVEPYWLDASTLVDQPSLPRRIAVTSGPWVRADNWFVYPFLGRRLQNEVFYVPVSRDGVIRHFGSPAVNEEYLLAADFFSWLTRLRRERVTHVMSFSPASVELGWMERHPELFTRLSGGAGDWGLFAIGEAPQEQGS